MRALGMVIALLLTGGCSVLDQIMLSSGPQLDPNKVYLGRSIVLASPREVHRYACVDGPLLCESRGISLECGCAW